MRIYAPWLCSACDDRLSACPIFGQDGGVVNGWDGHDKSGSTSKSNGEMPASAESGVSAAVLVELQRPYDPGITSNECIVGNVSLSMPTLATNGDPVQCIACQRKGAPIIIAGRRDIVSFGMVSFCAADIKKQRHHHKPVDIGPAGLCHNNNNNNNNENNKNNNNNESSNPRTTAISTTTSTIITTTNQQIEITNISLQNQEIPREHLRRRGRDCHAGVPQSRHGSCAMTKTTLDAASSPEYMRGHCPLAWARAT